MACDHADDFGHILDLRVDDIACEVEDEERPEQAEQMHAQLVSHGELVPPNAFAYSSFDSSVVVDVLEVSEHDSVFGGVVHDAALWLTVQHLS